MPPTIPDALSVPSFAAYLGHLRAEQILRALSARTNRTLAASRVRVVGDGPLAEALWTALGRLGAHVTAVSDDPRTALRARLRGLPTLTGATGADEADHVIVTGEGHGPLDPATLRGTVIDASFDGTGLRPVDPARAARPGVHPAGAAWVVE
ncbi:MAG: hypothetical protein QM604_08060, partial [Microbacterium sp.]